MPKTFNNIGNVKIWKNVENLIANYVNLMYFSFLYIYKY